MTCLVLDPEHYDTKYLHVFKWDNSNYGGVSLRPRQYFGDGVKEINKVVCKKTFDILNNQTPGKYFDNNPMQVMACMVCRQRI